MNTTFAAINSELISQAIEKQLNKRVRTYEDSKKGVTIYSYDDITKISEYTPRIILKNKNNGTTAFTLTIGLYRYVCSNGLMLGETAFYERIIHRKGVTFDTKMQRVHEIVANILSTIDNLIYNKISELEKVSLTLNQMVEIVDALKYPKKLTKQCKFNIRIRKRDADSANNAWILFNLINESIRDMNGRNTQAAFDRDYNLLSKIETELKRVA